MKQNTIEESLLDIYGLILSSLDRIETVLNQVRLEFKQELLNELVDVFDELFNHSILKDHIVYQVQLVGKSTVAFGHLQNLNPANSNRHITLEIASGEFIFVNQLYDGKFSDLLKFYKHIFSLIENFSISKNTEKVDKFTALVQAVREDFVFLNDFYAQSERTRIFNAKILKAISFLSNRIDKKAGWQRYFRLLAENSVQSLYHFTDIKNIGSIIQNGGLYSWAYCENNGIEIACPGGNDYSRKLDLERGMENYVRLSLCESHPMRYIAARDGRLENPITLTCDPEIILYNSTLFSNMNAARREAIIRDDLDFLNMFNFQLFREDYLSIRNDRFLASHYQSEILVYEHLELRHILNINEFH